jgi:hypothetical protein
MTRNELIRQQYSDFSTEDRQTFDRWLRANVVIASLFSAALLAIAFAGGQFSVGPRTATAEGPAGNTELSSSSRAHPRDGLSVQELMRTIDLDKLPIQWVDEPY